jgi:2-amino-4-hydroxy-6-hydroxymethyldihydropteridine diphosphokinase
MKRSGTEVEFALSLGGNIGDTEAFFDFALKKLSDGGATGLRRSSIYRTKPVNCVENTPDFSNCAVTGRFCGSGCELLELLQRTEREAGRPAEHSSMESRVLDCDIIIFGGEVINEKNLTVPHPRAKIRRFVLEPLSEIAPQMCFADDGVSVAEALQKLEANDTFFK